MMTVYLLSLQSSRSTQDVQGAVGGEDSHLVPGAQRHAQVSNHYSLMLYSFSPVLLHVLQSAICASLSSPFYLHSIFTTLILICPRSTFFNKSNKLRAKLYASCESLCRPTDASSLMLFVYLTFPAPCLHQSRLATCHVIQTTN